MIVKTEVVSSNVNTVGYDHTKKDLLVMFKNGGAYAYHEVPADIYFATIKSESVGKSINMLVKPHFKFTKLEGWPNA